MAFNLTTSKTAKWGFTFVTPSGLSNSPETQYNATLKALDALLSRQVISFTTATPPGSPTEGDMYYIPAAATGVWSGYSYHLAIYVDGSWLISTDIVPQGTVFWDSTASSFVIVGTSGSRWAILDSTATPTNVATLTQSISSPPVQAEVANIRDKLIEVAEALEDLGLVSIS